MNKPHEQVSATNLLFSYVWIISHFTFVFLLEELKAAVGEGFKETCFASLKTYLMMVFDLVCEICRNFPICAFPRIRGPAIVCNFPHYLDLNNKQTPSS